MLLLQDRQLPYHDASPDRGGRRRGDGNGAYAQQPQLDQRLEDELHRQQAEQAMLQQHLVRLVEVLCSFLCSSHTASNRSPGGAAPAAGRARHAAAAFGTDFFWAFPLAFLCQSLHFFMRLKEELPSVFAAVAMHQARCAAAASAAEEALPIEKQLLDYRLWDTGVQGYQQQHSMRFTCDMPTAAVSCAHALIDNA